MFPYFLIRANKKIRSRDRKTFVIFYNQLIIGVKKNFAILRNIFRQFENRLNCIFKRTHSFKMRLVDSGNYADFLPDHFANLFYLAPLVLPHFNDKNFGRIIKFSLNKLGYTQWRIYVLRGL